MTETPASATTADKLDQILYHLDRMDRRDRLRTIGGFFRGILTLIPMLIFLFSMWYFYKYSDQILQKIAEQAAMQAAKFAQPSMDNSELMKQVEKYIKR